MIRKLLATIGIMTVIGLGMGAPAQAAVNGCPEATGYLCLYQNVNFGAGRWQVSFQTANVTCISLANSHFTNGDPVLNKAASLTITPQSGATNFRWIVYEDLGCSGNSRAFNAGVLGQSSNLSYFTPSMYQNISSVYLCAVGTIYCPL